MCGGGIIVSRAPVSYSRRTIFILFVIGRGLGYFESSWQEKMAVRLPIFAEVGIHCP